MKTLQGLELGDITPQNLMNDKGISDIAKSIDPQLKLVTGSAREALILPRLDELDIRIVDILAWQYHTDFYELAERLDVKRDLVRNSISWHMKKGTKFAILRALDMLGIKAEYQNWYEFGGEPYTFRISAVVLSEYYQHSAYDEIVANILRAIDDSKAARSYLAGLDTKIMKSDRLHMYHGIGQGLTGRRIMNLHHPETDYEIVQYTGIADILSGHGRAGINTGEREIESSLVCAIFPIKHFGYVGVRSELLTETEREIIYNS